MEDFEKQLKQAFLEQAKHSTPECIPLNTIGMYIENKLSGEEASKIQQHIGSCAHCMKRLVELRDTLSIVRKAESGLEKDLEKINEQKVSVLFRVYEWIKGVFQSRSFVYAFSTAVLLIAIVSLISTHSHKSLIPDYVVQLKALNAQGNVIKTGLGVVASPDGVIYTKASDVAGAASFDADIMNKVYCGEGFVYINKANDLVALKVNGKDLPYAALSSSKPDQKVIAISTSFKTSQGYLKTVRAVKSTSPDKEVDLIEITISKPGDYGVVISDNGGLVGMSPVLAENGYLAWGSDAVKSIPQTATVRPLSDITGTSSEEATRSYMQGMLAISNNNTESAINNLERSFALNPYNENAGLELADLYYNKGQEDRAISLYKKIIEINPENTDAIYLLGVGYEDTGQYDLALETYKQGLSIKPDDIDMLDNLGMLYLIKGDYQKARQIAVRLKPLKPALSKELELLLQKINK